MKKISTEDLLEIRKRDFLQKKDHYKDKEEIKTNFKFGNDEKQDMFLTIIVPVYNHPIAFIKRAITSVLYQECDFDYEILVIDDFAAQKAETETEVFLKEINDYRIKYYKNESNLGVFANWNRGIELSKGKWVTILHTDDFFKCNLLQTFKSIVDVHPEIDQLACRYKMLNFLKDDINVSEEYLCSEKNVFIRKVKYTEYLYEMKTSVKGSFYKKEKLESLGGFRSQGDGIGLDDYPLMMRFAYYYNTYLIEDVLYLDSWGYNDSLNTKHWYPELVENYYMWKYFANKEPFILKKLYMKKAKYLLKKRAIEFHDGTSWVGVPIEIDFEQLKLDCEVDYMKGNKLEEKLVNFIIRGVQYLKNHPHKGFYMNTIPKTPLRELE